MPTQTDRIAAAITASGVLDGFTVTVRVSARRRALGVTVEPGGTALTVAVPATIESDETVQILRRMRPRIAGHVLRARENAPAGPTPELVDGEGFMWLGRSARLRLVDGTAPVERVHTDTGYWLHAGRDLLAREGARPIVRWYCEQGTAWLRQEAPRFWCRMAASGAPLPELRVANIGRKRWGKYEPARHRVTLAWQSLQLPPSLARYVIVHELAHATRPGGAPHGPEFWRAADRGIPLAREKRRRLDKEGRTVWMGETAPRPAAN
ncbi:M48 family metallopeptidase [Streptomyces halobius]|uniref:M48 family metallopeptidase n=1 Tax=Streptomyces halobius TaxID=2879846 RepID=A0ABY4MD44_9ACTN|nr:YgjP-like metallopeptidase domain-containing protein [Streptomyces halobius]UQA95652.1 M48 family metallopeptidase [Streptomyces halobius]